MKTLFSCLVVIFVARSTLSLHFDLTQENNRCFIEELFKGSVAIIKYKIWSNTPEHTEKGNNLLS